MIFISYVITINVNFITFLKFTIILFRHVRYGFIQDRNKYIISLLNTLLLLGNREMINSLFSFLKMRSARIKIKYTNAPDNTYKGSKVSVSEKMKTTKATIMNIIIDENQIFIMPDMSNEITFSFLARIYRTMKVVAKTEEKPKAAPFNPYFGIKRIEIAKLENKPNELE